MSNILHKELVRENSSVDSSVDFAALTNTNISGNEHYFSNTVFKAESESIIRFPRSCFSA
jgi:hypothetical protein